MVMMVDKKQIFLFEFKRGHQAVVTTHNINNTFGSGTTIANKCTVQWWFKKFCKGDKSLDGEKGNGQPLEVNNNQLRPIIEPDCLTTIWEVVEEAVSTILRSLEANWKGGKAQ